MPHSLSIKEQEQQAQVLNDLYQQGIKNGVEL